MNKYKLYIKHTGQFIGFLAVFRKHNVHALTALLAVCCCTAIIFSMQVPVCSAASFTSSSARDGSEKNMYFEEGKFGTTANTDAGFETAPDGSRKFTTGSPAKETHGPDYPYKIDVRPEIKPVVPATPVTP